MKTPDQIVKLMLENDAFSRWMGLKVVAIDKGICTLEAMLRDEMLNGFDILHGGISYAMADSALAFAANAHGNKCVSIETSISHIRPAKSGDLICIEAKEMHRGQTIGIYEVEVRQKEGKAIALFKGTVHITKELW